MGGKETCAFRVVLKINSQTPTATNSFSLPDHLASCHLEPKLLILTIGKSNHI